MIKTQWIPLLITLILSCGSLVLIIVSFVTNYWIVAEARSDAANKNSQINYGLWSGSLTRNVLISEAYYKLTIVCINEENACIYSCQVTEELREDELRRILSGSSLLECQRMATRTGSLFSENEPNVYTTNISISTMDEDTDIKNNFINFGMWLATIIFLGIAAFFSFISAVFSLINILFNPVEPVLSILGLYIWNGSAAIASVVTLTIWGILFGISLSENIAISDTLRLQVTFNSDGLAALGFSFWILIIPPLFHIGNIGLLLWRTRMIEMEPPPPTITVDKNDLTLMLY